jgi:hypothetical protein
MSAKPENTFISSVHKHLPVELYHMKNNNPYNSGIADVWYSGVEQDLWVEYKFLVIPKRGDTVIDLVGGKNPSISALQQTWLKDRDAEGRNVGVIVGSKEGGVWFPNTSWDFTYTASQFREWIVSRKELAGYINSFVGGPIER